MPTREELEEIMNNKPYGFGRKLITKKLKTFQIETQFSLRPKDKISIIDVVVAANKQEACFPGNELVKANQKQKELQEKYPEFWVTSEKRATELP
jgi:hypothetical protein